MKQNTKKAPGGKSESGGIKDNRTDRSIIGRFLNLTYFDKYCAIPNIEDGLTPVQRIILHVLFEVGFDYKISSIIIKKCMDYFFHGNINIDEDICDALIELVQKKYFVKGQGNWGSVYSGDPAAHPDFTECRATAFGLEVFYNPKLTCYIGYYKREIKMPVCFPAKIPAVLLPGIEGDNTRILPHNLGEILNAVKACLSGEKFILYPDFPTGGLIDISNYQDGNGEVLVRAKLDISNPERIIIHELPYGSTFESITTSIEKASKKGKIQFKEIWNESDIDEVRIVIELARGISSREAAEILFTFTECQKSISTNLVVMKDGTPTTMTVTEVVKYYTDQLVEILTWELEKERKQLLEEKRIQTMEKLFLDNNIIDDFKKRKKKHDIKDFVIEALNPLVKDKGFREMGENDAKHLLRMPIQYELGYRWNYNSDKRIKDINEHLSNITTYAINYLDGLSHYVCKRKTKICKFGK